MLIQKTTETSNKRKHNEEKPRWHYESSQLKRRAMRLNAYCQSRLTDKFRNLIRPPRNNKNAINIEIWLGRVSLIRTIVMSVWAPPVKPTHLSENKTTPQSRLEALPQRANKRQRRKMSLNHKLKRLQHYHRQAG